MATETSIFDPDNFLSTEYTEPTSTEYILVDEGEYSAQVDDVKIRKTEGNDGDFFVMEVYWHILDEAVAKAVGRDKPIVRQSLFLELTPSGSLDMSKGKNVPLGYLREAVGQNKKGKSWSPRQLFGSTALVKVSHKPRKNEPERVDASVTKVTKG